ncbi:MAG: histidinol phosphate phosphatase domain-containing protein [Planctomycetes bacterium]|jgi:histidinol phosphatase-like PHP family hydrolase|nr:histidinol phosphate phosphatase domain-containing protein [Planctomycetota bacterium]
MIDFHTHTLLSDGALIPTEHIRRAEVRGYRVLGMADHAGLAESPRVLPELIEAARRENELGRLRVFAGVELTHVRPEQMSEAVDRARELGAAYVIAHGETIVEPVEPGTNRAAIEAGVDILAHPGLISPDDVKLAAKRGVRLEISGKAGHSLSNGHVAKLATALGATLIFGSDGHTPSQMPMRDFAEDVCLAAGLDEATVAGMFAAAETLADSLAAR